MSEHTPFSRHQDRMAEISLVKETSDEKVDIRVECIVKGYHECQFTTYIGEEFVASKKLGPKGKAFRVSNSRGQLGHLQSELVNAFWPWQDSVLKS